MLSHEKKNIIIKNKKIQKYRGLNQNSYVNKITYVDYTYS